MKIEDPPAAANAVVTVRGLAPELKARLRIRAAHNARSMEAEARAILEFALSAPEEDTTDLASFARVLFAPLGGVELDLPARTLAREPPGFEYDQGQDRSPPPSAEPVLAAALVPDQEFAPKSAAIAPAKVRRRRS